MICFHHSVEVKIEELKCLSSSALCFASSRILVISAAAFCSAPLTLSTSRAILPSVFYLKNVFSLQYLSWKTTKWTSVCTEINLDINKFDWTKCETNRDYGRLVFSINSKPVSVCDVCIMKVCHTRGRADNRNMTIIHSEQVNIDEHDNKHHQLSFIFRVHVCIRVRWKRKVS